MLDPNNPTVVELKRTLQSMYTQNNRHFAFKNQQIANTPYHLVKGFPDQQVVRQSDYENQYKKPINCVQKNTDFDK